MFVQCSNSLLPTLLSQYAVGVFYLNSRLISDSDARSDVYSFDITLYILPYLEYDSVSNVLRRPTIIHRSLKISGVYRVFEHFVCSVNPAVTMFIRLQLKINQFIENSNEHNNEKINGNNNENNQENSNEKNIKLTEHER